MLASSPVAGGREPDKSGKAPDAPPEIVVKELRPTDAYRGTEVTVSGSGFPEGVPVKVFVDDQLLKAEAKWVDSKSVAFVVPDEIELGTHRVRVKFEPKDKAAVERVVPAGSGPPFRVLSSTPEKLTVTGIVPKVGYPDGARYGFTVLGEGFSRVPNDNKLFLKNGTPIPVNHWSKGPLRGGNSPPAGEVWGYAASSRELQFQGIPSEVASGREEFYIQVGENKSEARAVTLARVPRYVPIAAAAACVAAIVGCLFWMVGRVRANKIAGVQPGLLAKFLLDPETDTLSLSKFQFYVWTAVTAFGYVYLTVARSLIQWVFEFAPIPEGMPGIVLVSAGTTAVAAAVTSARGPDGAGEEEPGWGDLLTSGGVVLPERVQFLVWTVLGALAFLFLVVLHDPGTIEKLPKIPEEFLYLMGISSAGYLGGKLARKPGPVIDTIVAQEGSVVLEIQGRNLSRQAGFRIDDEEVTIDPPARTAAAADTDSPMKDARLVVAKPDDAGGKSEFALVLRLVIDLQAWRKRRRLADAAATAADAWLAAEHRLTLTNPDGQKAVWAFTVSPEPAKTFELLVPEPVKANEPFDLTLVVKSPHGRTATHYAGTVRVTLDKPAEGDVPAERDVLPDFTFTAADLGTHKFKVTPKKAGAWVITVTDVAGGLTVAKPAKVTA
jgi:hypothetical protein